MIDKETFLKGLTPERVVALPGLGDVRVRGLTRAEAVGLAEHKDNTGALERIIIHTGLVEPSLTMDEVNTWYAQAQAGLTDILIGAIEELSGLKQGAQKSDVPGVRRGQRS